MTLKLVDSLKASIEELDKALAEPPCEGADGIGQSNGGAEVVDFKLAKARTALSNEVDVETVLRLALEDAQQLGQKAVKCYVTVILDDDEDNCYSQCHYRCNMTKPEEIAFRQLGVAEVLDSWRHG